MATVTRVLIADDSPFARAFLRGLLRERGYDVVGEASSAAEAVSLYKVLLPDVVTLDFSMPGLTGLDAVLALRDLNARCKVLIVTAVRDDPVVKGLAAMGVPIVAKPVQWEQFETELRGCAPANACGI